MSFNLITLIAKNCAVGWGDKGPWDNPEYMDYFDKLTMGGIVIMGRKTFSSLPDGLRPLPGRINIVLSNAYGQYRTLQSENLVFTNMYYVNSKILPENPSKQVWIVGGADVYANLYNQCTRIYMMMLDKVFPNVSATFASVPPSFELVDYSEKHRSEYEGCDYRLLRYDRNFVSQCLNHESQYLRMLRDIIDQGNTRTDRTNVGTIGSFGGQQKYDVSMYLPILTTKLVPIKMIIKELLWFMRGDTDVKNLQKQGVHIWDGNSSEEFLRKRGLPYKEGDIGPGYGFQWRHFGADYVDCSTDYGQQGVDQIAYVLDLLKNDPFSRRILLSAWNPTCLDDMALPPCHVLFQLYVTEDADGNRYLSGHLYQRSQDYFLAANYNLVSYTVLLYILAKKVGYFPKEMIVSWGDVHVYSNHVEQARTQLTRQPLPQPILELDDSIADKDINDITIDDFELIAYHHAPPIKASMAV
jgi:thymidylate synthase